MLDVCGSRCGPARTSDATRALWAAEAFERARASERRRSCSAPSLRVRPAPLLARSQRPCPTRFRSLLCRERNALIRFKTVPPLPDAIDRARCSFRVCLRERTRCPAVGRGGSSLRCLAVLPLALPALQPVLSLAANPSPFPAYSSASLKGRDRTLSIRHVVASSRSRLPPAQAGAGLRPPPELAIGEQLVDGQLGQRQQRGRGEVCGGEFGAFSAASYRRAQLAHLSRVSVHRRRSVEYGWGSG